MSEGSREARSAAPLALTPAPAPRVVPPSPPEGRGTVVGGEAAESTLHKADPAVRRKLLLLLAPAGLAVFLGFAWWFDDYMNNLPVETAQQMKASTQDVIDEFVRALYASAALLGLLAFYWFQLGRRIEAAPQYPMPHMRLFHDMRILRGEAKRKQARRSRYSAIAALAIAALLLGGALYLPRRIVTQHPFLFPQAAPAASGAAAPAP